MNFLLTTSLYSKINEYIVSEISQIKNLPILYLTYNESSTFSQK